MHCAALVYPRCLPPFCYHIAASRPPPYPRRSLPIPLGHSPSYQAATPFIATTTCPFIFFGRRSLPPDSFTTTTISHLILLEETGESADGKVCRKLTKVCRTSVRPFLSPHSLHL